jgi:hypothetical protein
MKVRHQRKLAQAKVRYGNEWNWAFEKMIKAVCAAHNKMSKALQETYERAIREQQTDSQGT